MPVFTHVWNTLLYENFAALQNVKLYFKTYENAWKQFKVSHLRELSVSEKTVQRILAFKKSGDPLALFAELKAKGIHTVTSEQDEYPELLKEISQVPPIIYYMGSLDALDKINIAVVGTRRNSIYGKQCTEKISAGLVRQGVTIISGLAFGIDSIAHRAALEANGSNGRTIAVLAHGLNHLHPARHRALAREIIAQGGALISEFPPAAPALRHHFTRRNRIISGLSKAIVVVECPYKSGAMNTAKHARDQNREVFVVPGDITRPQSMGPFKLLRSPSAVPIASAKDIFETLNLDYSKSSCSKPAISNSSMSKAEQQLLKTIHANRFTSLQEISDESNYEIQDLTKLLTQLEIAGAIKQESGAYIRKLH